MAEAPEHRHDFERRLNDEIGCAEGCSCLSPAIYLAEEMCDRIAELEAALAGLLRLPWAIAEKDHLRKGIGTATSSGQAWLAAFKAAGINLKD